MSKSTRIKYSRMLSFKRYNRHHPPDETLSHVPSPSATLNPITSIWTVAIEIRAKKWSAVVGSRLTEWRRDAN